PHSQGPTSSVGAEGPLADPRPSSPTSGTREEDHPMTEQATRSTRAESLAARFEQVNAELIATVEGLSEAQWGATTPEERWTVAVTAHHVATSYPPITRMVEQVIAGGTVPNFREGLDERNARHSQEFARCDRGE